MGRFVGQPWRRHRRRLRLQSFIGQGEREMGFRAVSPNAIHRCRLLTVLETREQPEKAGELVSAILETDAGSGGV